MFIVITRHLCNNSVRKFEWFLCYIGINSQACISCQFIYHNLLKYLPQDKINYISHCIQKVYIPLVVNIVSRDSEAETGWTRHTDDGWNADNTYIYNDSSWQMSTWGNQMEEANTDDEGRWRSPRVSFGGWTHLGRAQIVRRCWKTKDYKGQTRNSWTTITKHAIMCTLIYYFILWQTRDQICI